MVFLQVAEFHMKWKIVVLVMFYFVTQDQEITTSNPTKICSDHTILLINHYRSKCPGLTQMFVEAQINSSLHCAHTNFDNL